MITIKGQEIKNFPREMTIGEFEKVTKMVNMTVSKTGEDEPKADFQGQADKWLYIFEQLGLSEENIETITKDELIQAVNDFNQKDPSTYDLVSEFSIGGKTYHCAIEEGKEISAKRFALVERMVKKEPSKIPSLIVASIFDDGSLTKNEHYSDAHVKHKADIFQKELNASIAIPYIPWLMNEIMKGKKELIQELENEGDNTATMEVVKS